MTVTTMDFFQLERKFLKFFSQKYVIVNCYISFTLVLKWSFWRLEVPTSLVMVVKNKTTYLTKHLTKIFFTHFTELFQNY